MAIHEQLEKLGYKPEDIDIVVFTHLHWDHMFYVESSRMRHSSLMKESGSLQTIRFAVLQIIRTPCPWHYRPFEGLEFTTVSGETEIMPGVRVLKHLAIHPDIYQLKSIQKR